MVCFTRKPVVLMMRVRPRKHSGGVAAHERAARALIFNIPFIAVIIERNGNICYIK